MGTLNGIGKETTIIQTIERIEHANRIVLDAAEAQGILNFYSDIKLEDGLYNPKHLPFELLAKIQTKHNSVGWNSMQHTADYSELALFGPGSECLTPFIKNTDLHYIMLQAAEIENKF